MGTCGTSIGLLDSERYNIARIWSRWENWKNEKTLSCDPCLYELWSLLTSPTERTIGNHTDRPLSLTHWYIRAAQWENVKGNLSFLIYEKALLNSGWEDCQKKSLFGIAAKMIISPRIRELGLLSKFEIWRGNAQGNGAWDCSSFEILNLEGQRAK